MIDHNIRNKNQTPVSDPGSVSVNLSLVAAELKIMFRVSGRKWGRLGRVLSGWDQTDWDGKSRNPEITTQELMQITFKFLYRERVLESSVVETISL